MRVDKFMAQGMTFGEAAVARKAEREANAKKRAAAAAAAEAAGTNTHCQVCARLIKSKSGTIAHHGYKRPGGGWQTASCFGAKRLPWELACDAIPPCIQHVESFIVITTGTLEAHNTSPPASMVYRDSWGKGLKDVDKPADFVPEAKAPGSYSPRSYASMYYRLRASLEQQITQAKYDLKMLNARYAEWHKLHPEAKGDRL